MSNQIFVILNIYNLPWVSSNMKFGPDRFSRFNVYWIQIDKQTDRQAMHIYRYID